MAKTRTGRSNKKLKMDPMDTLLEFKRHEVPDFTKVEAEEAAPAADTIDSVAAVSSDIQAEMQVEIQEEMQLDEVAEPSSGKDLAADSTMKSFESQGIQTDSPAPLSDTNLTSLLQKSEQKYALLLQKYSLLESLSHQNHLDEYKALHQERLGQLESTIEMLKDERNLLLDKLKDAPSDGVSPRRHQELLEEIEKLKSELGVFKDKSMELESTVKLYATKQTSLEAEIKELHVQIDGKSKDLDEVVQDRSKVVEELKSLTTLLTDQTALARRLDEAYQKLKLEKSDLEAVVGQTNATLAKLQATSSNSGNEELMERINEETMYSQKLESICELAESMTGITVQNLELRLRRPLESSIDSEYSCFTIKQRGSVHSIAFDICCPIDQKLKVAYIPSAKLKAVSGLPDFLEDEIEFEKEMLQEFFGNLKKFVDGEMVDQVD